MKKNYTMPQMDIAFIEANGMIAISGVKGQVGTTGSIGYGGVDTDGSKDPSVKADNGWLDYE